MQQNRLLKIAREGGQMTPAELAKFEPQQRYATLVALARDESCSTALAEMTAHCSICRRWAGNTST